MLAWSCRAPGGEEKAVNVDSAVQLGRFLFNKYGLQGVPERIHVSVLSWNVFNTVSKNFCGSELKSFSLFSSNMLEERKKIFFSPVKT